MRGAHNPNSIKKMFGQFQSPLFVELQTVSFFGSQSTGTSRDEVRPNIDANLIKQKYIWKGICVSFWTKTIFTYKSLFFKEYAFRYPAKHNINASYTGEPFALRPGSINCACIRISPQAWCASSCHFLPSFLLHLELLVRMSSSYHEP